MRYVRAAALFGVLGSLIFAAGCSGGSGGGATPPIPVDQNINSPLTEQNTPTDTSATTTTDTTTLSTTATAGIPRHVMNAAVFWGYGGVPTTVSITRAAPWLNWVQTSPTYARTVRAYGLKVDAYLNFWRDYSIERPTLGYDDLKPGGAHAAAEARTCRGSVIRDSTYGGGYEADARSSAAVGHAAVLANYRKWEYGNGTTMDAYFTDDTGAMGGLPLPCNFSISTYQTATNRVTASLLKPTFVNTLRAGNPVTQTGYLNATNIIGGMCELCIAYNNRTLGRDVAVTGSQWTLQENAAIITVAKHKIFWLYARAAYNPAYETPLRKFMYASFLLTYSPQYSMYQDAFKTPSGFPVMPETGIVPMQPLTTASSVTGYLRSGGTYMREFGACYYLGVLKGRCAVVVNPGGSTARIATTAYAHSVVLTGYDVLDGGTVSFAGGRVTSLPPAGGAILFR